MSVNIVNFIAIADPVVRSLYYFLTTLYSLEKLIEWKHST